MDLKSLAGKAAAARHRSAGAATTQERQHWDGMAHYWQELIDEQSKAAPADRRGSSEGRA
jgi:hypothetical protein